MSNTLEVHVTEQDILDGLQGSPAGCPIALAMHSAGARRACAYVGVLVWEDAEGYKWSCDPPYVAQEFIDKFDTDAPVSPIEFTIEGTPYRVARHGR